MGLWASNLCAMSNVINTLFAVAVLVLVTVVTGKLVYDFVGDRSLGGGAVGVLLAVVTFWGACAYGVWRERSEIASGLRRAFRRGDPPARSE